MSAAVSIRAALETALNAMSPSLATSWENQNFTPPALSTPYQVVNVLFAKPDNTAFGQPYQELGFMQVKLMYPVGAGTAAVNARAELIRSTFTRGTSFTSGGITTMILSTPEIQPGNAEDGRFAVVVSIPFFANIN